MKKSALLILVLAAALNAAYAQNFDDALRYSQIFYNGTARFNSMGGAFTALGGDVSSLNQNPAGLGVFRSSEMSLSPQLFNFRSKTNFNNSLNDDYLYNFNLGQGGVILNLINNQATSGLITLNFGYSYSRTNNFEETIEIGGASKGSSLLDYWAEKAKGIVDTALVGDLNAADAYLGWYTWLLDPVPGTNDTVYGTAYTNYGRYTADYGKYMTRTITNSGNTGEHSFSLAANYSNKLFIGAALRITRVEYESNYEHSEKSDSVLASGFRSFNYSYYYRNWGTGYSLKLGVIFKPVEPLRIGLSFQSPTLFRISEYLNDNIVSHVEGRENTTKENDASWFKYSLTTPFRATLGVAYQVRKLGVISAEYEFVDYGMAKFSTIGNDDYDYTKKNQDIKYSLKSTSNIRVGAEARLNRLYLRGGYGYYGRAFKTGDINDNLFYNSYSGGLGFRDQNISVDFGFTRISNSEKFTLYNTDNPADDTPISNNDYNRNIFTVTFGYKFGI